MNISRKVWSWIFLFSLFPLSPGTYALEEETMDWIQAEESPCFSAAVDAAHNKTLVISGPQTLDADIAVPAETHLLFLKGGTIVQSDSFTLSIEGSVTAPTAPIFSGFSPKEVTFGAVSVKEACPQWWGARGDGKTDDTLALQCALDSGCAVIHIPKSRYLLNRPLNLTNRKNLIIRGDGSAEGAGTALIGNTGGLVLDVSGSRQVDLRDFDIVSGESDPSTVGILYARSDQVRFVEFNTLTNIGVFLTSLPEANNQNGSVAIYNYAAEIWRARNLYLVADNGVVFTGYNLFGIASPFTKLFSGYPSMSLCTIDGVSTIRGLKGPCVTCDNAVRIEILNAYLCGDNRIQDAFPYAVKVTEPGFFTNGLTVTGHKERDGGWLYTNVNLRNVKLDGTGVGAESGPVVHLEPPYGAILNGDISIDPITEREMDLLHASGKGGYVRNVTLNLFEQQKIHAPYIEFSGNMIHTSQTLSQARKAIEVAPGASYMLMARDDIYIQGSHTTGQKETEE